MDFPITDLLDDEASTAWLMAHFHPDGLRCPKCRAPADQARIFRQTRRSRITVYRCRQCQRVYNLYWSLANRSFSTRYGGQTPLRAAISGVESAVCQSPVTSTCLTQAGTETVFEGTRLRPAPVVLLVRGVCKGEPSTTLAREISVSRTTVHIRRHILQANAERLQPTSALSDSRTETDELFQNAGEKGEKHADPADPPGRRANKRRGHGTYANDRLPVVGTVGRASGQVRLRVVPHTDGKTLPKRVPQFTQAEATAYTAERPGYKAVARAHATVARGQKESARDDDGDGIREVHVNTIEG